jgi:hypothetical protein
MVRLYQGRSADAWWFDLSVFGIVGLAFALGAVLAWRDASRGPTGTSPGDSPAPKT